MDGEHLTWMEVYLRIRREFCGRCEADCTAYRKAFCIEQFLWITEMWEVSNDPERDV
jgi:hypothetical protein